MLYTKSTPFHPNDQPLCLCAVLLGDGGDDCESREMATTVAIAASVTAVAVAACATPVVVATVATTAAGTAPGVAFPLWHGAPIASAPSSSVHAAHLQILVFALPSRLLHHGSQLANDASAGPSLAFKLDEDMSGLLTGAAGGCGGTGGSGGTGGIKGLGGGIGPQASPLAWRSPCMYQFLWHGSRHWHE